MYRINFKSEKNRYMHRDSGLTRIDLLVAVACLAFLLVNIPVILAGGREKAKQDVCMQNLRSLTAAWQTYAGDNAGLLVNGAPNEGGPCPSEICSPGTNNAATVPTQAPWNRSDLHQNELPWIGMAWTFNPNPCGFAATECGQKCAIRTGALWPYLKEENIYHCPAGDKDWLVNYSIVDSMNGKWKWNKRRGGVDSPKSVCLKNINQVQNASQRFVFIDEGRVSPDSYGVYLQDECWFDPPMAPHSDGTIVSFADGHSAYLKWKSQQTIDAANNCVYNFVLSTCDARNDLYKVQIGCWGKLWYSPSCPVE